jgi:hypothetical protein
VRALLSVSIGLTFAGSLAAQSEVPGDQCLGGWLVAIQQDSLSMKFNEKITTMRLAPDAEIWRRGADLENIHQLVAGDEIDLRCTRAAGSGAVVASMVAAVETGDSVRMEPHHIAEIRICAGYLVAVAKGTLSVKSDNGICVVRVNADTKLWRGEYFHDTDALKPGDDIAARAIVGYPGGELTAEEVTAKLTNTEGTIAAVRPDRIVVNQDLGNGNEHLIHPRVRVTVLFDAHTVFDPGRGKLKKGATVLAVGLDLGHNTFRASTVIVEKQKSGGPPGLPAMLRPGLSSKKRCLCPVSPGWLGIVV